MNMILADTILSKDVLIGHSPCYRNHPGNVSLRELVEWDYHRYENCNGKLEKTKLSQGIVDIIVERGGRFLKQTNNQEQIWQEVDGEEARDKVASMFRSTRKRKRRECELDALFLVWMEVSL